MLVAITIYICLMVIVVLVKSPMIYSKETQSFKKFGGGKNETYVPLPVLAIIGALLSVSVTHK